MSILNQQVNIVSNRHNIQHYIKRGYDGCQCGDIITVNINDLKHNATIKVLFRCDFCGEVFERMYSSYAHDNHPQWCACPKCVGKKRKEIFKLEFGVENVMQREDIKEKLFETNMERYGCKIGLQNKEIRDKQKKTNLKRYGTEYAIAAQQTRNKIQQTMQTRYGVENPSQIDEVMDKIQQTRYKNNQQASSKQQRLLCQYYNGELNYPFKRRYIDIALLDEKIAIEYNGGGHNLSVKLGELTEQEFNRNEKFRKKQLFEGDWKLIEFISPQNRVVSEDVAIHILDMCRYLFNMCNKHYIKIYIDDDKVMNSDDTICYKNTLNDWNEKTP